MAMAIPIQAMATPHRLPAVRAHRNEDGIPSSEVRTLVHFKSRHNFIRVLHVSRKADHPFAGARLLLLDAPGNIHSLSFLRHPFTHAYFDAFAALPPLLPPGPLALLGFGAGSAARLILDLYPDLSLLAWELDPAVLSVAREFFALDRLEKDYAHRLTVFVGDALEEAESVEGFAGILVDLFSKGCLLPELQDPATWRRMKGRLRRGGRIMVNVGGSCVEAEDPRRDGRVLMWQTLEAMERVFPGRISVLSLGNGEDDSSLALTGTFPDAYAWKERLPEPIRCYADKWKPFRVPSSV